MNDLKHYPISIKETIAASKVVYQYLKPTQLIYYPALSAALKANIYIKHENHHPTGCFKIRGGVNLLHHLKQKQVKGVVTFSTGNHGLSIATAAKWLDIPAIIVLPETATAAKKQAIKDSGATLVEAGSTFEEAAQAVDDICTKQQYYYAHPANEPSLINGVGTEFVEIIQDLPQVDAVIVPIGGGSEAAAATTVFSALSPETELIAVQAELSSAAYQSWKEGKTITAPNSTFAGGFATGQGYELPLNIYQSFLKDFVLLSEAEIYQGIAAAAFYTHNLVEGAGASCIMAAYKLRERLKGKNVVLQMSGANAAPDELNHAYALPVFEQGFEH